MLPILQLFGVGGSDKLSAAEAEQVGPTRLSFWDCPLKPEYMKACRADDLPLTEVKSENSTNRITGTATNWR